MGVSKADSDRLRGAYVQWKNVHMEKTLSSLESVEDMALQGPAPGDSGTSGSSNVSSGGTLRVSKTTVRHVYRLQDRGGKKRRNQ